MFWACDFSNGSDVILARRGIESVEDLAGRRVAAEPASLELVFLSRALETAGLGLDDVEVVPTPQLGMPEALAAGVVDAVVTYPPNSFAILGQDTGHLLFDTSRVPGTIVDVLVADEELLVSRSDDIRRITRAFDRAISWAEENPDSGHARMARRQGVLPGEMKEGLSGLRMIRSVDQSAFLAEGGPLVESLGRTLGVMRREKLISGTGSVDRLVSRKALGSEGDS